MQKLKVHTTLHCDGCVAKVRPILDRQENIQTWSVDLAGDDAVLAVEGIGLSQEYVDQLLNQAGYAIKGSTLGQSFWQSTNTWGRASFNTLNCLIGCSIGDFGMVIYLQAFYPDTSIGLQMALAVLAGLCTSIALEMVLLRVREGFSWIFAFRTAMGMSFLSMVAMEIAMTSTDFMLTGGKAAFDDPSYWLALLPALVVGFLAPLPYNYYRLKKYNQACH